MIIGTGPDLRLGLTGIVVDETEGGSEGGGDEIKDNEGGGEKSVIMSHSLISLSTLLDRENWPG